MGKKKDKKKELKKAKKELQKQGIELPIAGKCKTKCCEKYQKSEKKRCKKCPCFDLLKKVA
ncbi:hypothetical protein [Formosa sp. S-31]|uniref:hypothetical protein n=1 Tax=Formosa sp. S-31 TaxID=2790949 RepID=UPI003EBA7C93